MQRKAKDQVGGNVRRVRNARAIEKKRSSTDLCTLYALLGCSFLGGLEVADATALGRLQSPRRGGPTISVFLPFSKLPLGLDGPGDQVDASPQRHPIRWLLFGCVDDLAESHDVAAGDPQHG